MAEDYNIQKNLDLKTARGKGIELDYDERTFYGKGFEPDIDLRTPYGKGFEPDIDSKTPYGKGFELDIDPRTDFGKSISFKSIDGRKWPTMEQAEAVNRAIYKSLILQYQNNTEEKTKHRR